MKRSVGQPTFGVEVDNERGAGYRWFGRLTIGGHSGGVLGVVVTP